MTKMSILTERLAAAGSLLLAIVPLVALGALAH